MAATIKVETKHFVEFFSPGTFVSETRSVEIGEWDTRAALRMMPGVTERYGAKPYGFWFDTRTVAENGVVVEITKKSPMHFVNGRVMTLADVEREMPTERILIDNMRCNGIERVVTGPANGKGNWRWTQPFTDGDILLDADGNEVK